MAPEDGERPNKSAFSLADYSTMAIGVFIGVPLCDAGWSNIVSGDHVFRGVIAVLAGIAMVTPFETFHWWKKYLTPERRKWVNAYIPAGVIGALLICVGYFLIPVMYRRATAPYAPLGFTQAQVDQKIAAAERPLKAQIKAINARVAPPPSRPAKISYTDQDKAKLREASRALMSILNIQAQGVIQAYGKCLDIWRAQDIVARKGSMPDTQALSDAVISLDRAIAALDNALSDGVDGFRAKYRPYLNDLPSIDAFRDLPGNGNLIFEIQQASGELGQQVQNIVREKKDGYLKLVTGLLDVSGYIYRDNTSKAERLHDVVKGIKDNVARFEKDDLGAR